LAAVQLLDPNRVKMQVIPMPGKRSIGEDISFVTSTVFVRLKAFSGMRLAFSTATGDVEACGAKFTGSEVRVYTG
jgi:hypothetical protein